MITLSCQPIKAVVKAEPKMAKENLDEPTDPDTSAEWKIWTYSTVTPLFIASECVILNIDGVILREGTNRWIAMAANPGVWLIQKMVEKMPMKLWP